VRVLIKFFETDLPPWEWRDYLKSVEDWPTEIVSLDENALSKWTARVDVFLIRVVEHVPRACRETFQHRSMAN